MPERTLVVKKQVIGQPGAYCATVSKGAVTLQCGVERKIDGNIVVLDELILPFDVAEELAQFMLEQIKENKQ